jgi:hypothetical protein
MCRRKRCRKRPPETPESKAFRRELARENRRENRRAIEAETVELVAPMWLERGVYIDKDGDPEKVAELCQFHGCYFRGCWVTLAIMPKINVAHHMDFDQALCEAGLKEFVRPCHPTDDEFVECVAILVYEVEPGVRTRMGIGEGQIVS